jgi:hypothetical protein
MNEVANICEKVGTDVKEVRAAIGSDQRIVYHSSIPAWVTEDHFLNPVIFDGCDLYTDSYLSN